MPNSNTSRYEAPLSTGRRNRQPDNHLSRLAARQRELEAELATARKANKSRPDRKRWHIQPPATKEDEGWFLTYLDVMTLLLVLLVVMLSYSGKKKIDVVKQAPSDASSIVALIPPLGELPAAVALSPIPASIGLLPGGNGLLPQIGLHHQHQAAPETDVSNQNAALPEETAATENDSLSPDTALTEEVATVENKDTPDKSETSATYLPASANEATEPAPDQPLPAAPVPPDMLAGLPLSELGDDIDIIVNERSVSFRINSEILFGSGQADLSLEGLAVLKRLVPVFNSVKHKITIEGHTDSVPMLHNRRYPSNWELSGARAGSVVRYLQANGVASTRLRAIGNADTRPLADNATPEGRANNRRVELVMERQED